MYSLSKIYNRLLLLMYDKQSKIENNGQYREKQTINTHAFSSQNICLRKHFYRNVQTVYWKENSIKFLKSHKSQIVKANRNRFFLQTFLFPPKHFFLLFLSDWALILLMTTLNFFTLATILLWSNKKKMEEHIKGLLQYTLTFSEIFFFPRISPLSAN